MTDIITTLHPETDEDTNLYPNIKKENIPNKSINLNRLDDDVTSILENFNQPKYYSVLPSGDVGLIVYTDGYLYYWNGTQYISSGIVYQATQVPNNSIGLNKLASDVINYIDEQGKPTQEQVNNWLDNHPEATTSVEDHSLTIDKLVVGTLGYVTPQMFGAVGGGIVDDTQAFQNAVNYQNVLIPDGTYLITDSIVLTNCKNFIGMGDVTLLLDISNQQSGVSSGSGLKIIDNENVYVANIKITENVPATTRIPTYDLAVKNSKYVVLDNIHVSNVSGPGFFVGYNSEHFIIKNCYSGYTRADGFHIQRGSKYFIVKDCYSEYNRDDCYGCISHDAENYGICEYGTFENCIGHDTIGTGGGFCLDGSKHIKVINCRINDTILSGVRSNRFRENSESSWYYPSDNSIINCEFYNVGKGTTGSRAGIELNVSGSHDIIGNIIINDTNYNNNGIYFPACLGIIRVINNRIEGFTTGINGGLDSAQYGSFDTKCHYIIENNFLRNLQNNGVGSRGNCGFTGVNGSTTILNNQVFELNLSNSANINAFYCFSCGIVTCKNNTAYATNEFTTFASSGNQLVYSSGNNSN